MSKAPVTTISCLEGIDQSMCPETCRDRFQIQSDGKPVFELIFDYTVQEEGASVYDCNARVKCLDPNVSPQDIPRVSNGFEFIGIVMSRLNQMMSDHEDMPEFYADMFYDEDGNKLTLPIKF